MRTCFVSTQLYTQKGLNDDDILKGHKTRKADNKYICKYILKDMSSIDDEDEIRVRECLFLRENRNNAATIIPSKIYTFGILISN